MEDVKAFLVFWAVTKNVSASTQNQVFNALLLFYRHVLNQEFGKVQGIVRAKRRPYIPVVLSRDGVDQIVKYLDPRFSPLSVDYEQLGPNFCIGAMRFRVVRNLIAHARLQRELAAVFEFSVQFALGTQEDVALDTPVIGQIARRVLNHANADVPEVLGAPVGQSAFAFVLGSWNLRPFGGAEWDVRHLHIDSFPSVNE